MAGFMSGFGRAFSESYENAADRRAKRDDDNFQIAFTSYLKRKDERDRYVREDGKMAKQAANLAQLAGIDDPLAVSAAYDMLRNGMSDTVILKEFSKPGAKFSATETTPRSKAAGTETQNQMVASGLSPAPSGTQTPEAPTEEPTQERDFLSELFGRKGPKARMEEEKRKANSRISQVTGDTPEDISAVDSFDPSEPTVSMPKATFTPGQDAVEDVSWQDAIRLRDTATDPVQKKLYDDIVKSHEAKSKAEEAIKADPLGTGMVFIAPDPETGKLGPVGGTKQPDGSIVDFNGNPIQGARLQSQEEKRMDLELEKMAPDAMKARAQTANTVSLYKEGGELIDIASANPTVLTTVGDVTQWVEGMSAEAKAAYSIIQHGGDINSPEAKKAFDKLDVTLSKYGVDQIAANKSLFDSKLLAMAYRVAAAEGQKSRDVSNKDFDRIRDIINNSHGNSRVFAQNLADYLGSLQKQEDDTQFLPYNQMIERYKKYTGGYSPEEPVISTQEALNASQDPGVKKVLSIINGDGIQEPEATPEETDKGPDTEGIDPEAIKLLKDNPELSDQFDQIFGKGAADKVLGTQKEEPNGGE